jgi:hypothetical protein
MKKLLLSTIFAIYMIAICMLGCDADTRTSDQKQQAAQERILQEGNSQVGMPNIKNFRERKIVKDILEMRDQDTILTYTYVFSEITGKFTFLGESIGYGIPYATQFTSPQKAEWHTGSSGYTILPQADPNGLFSPSTADGTWIMMLDPVSKKAAVQYIEPKISTFTYKLPANLVSAGY